MQKTQERGTHSSGTGTENTEAWATRLYLGGMHLGTYMVNSTITDSIFYYTHTDWLGTERARTNLSGIACETIGSLPFGDGQTISGTCGDISPMHFTGKERDSESNLDNFGARYFASTMGRFMTPDWAARPTTVPYAVFGDPQSLNLYNYVRNDPIANADADGHMCIVNPNGGGDECNVGNNIGNTKTDGNGSDLSSTPYLPGCAIPGAICGGATIPTKCGTWCGLAQRIKNGLTGHGFKTNEQLLPAGTVTTIQGEAYLHEPNASVTAAADAAGIVAAVKDVKGLGYASAAVSLANDRSLQNITTNVLGFIPGFDVPIAINGAFIDAFDYKMHQPTPGHDKSNVIPTNVCEDGACVANPDLQPNGGWTN